MTIRNQNIAIFTCCLLLAWTAAAGAVTWDYVYEADVFPLAEDAITDINCNPLSAFGYYSSTGVNNTVLNSDGTITIDDTDSFGSTNYIADILPPDPNMWSITQPVTVEFRLKLNEAVASLNFLSVTNHQSSIGYKWWIGYDADAETVWLWGDHVVGEPNSPQELIYLGPLDQWYTVRVNIPNGSPANPARLWAWNDQGVLATNPDDPQVTTCKGYDFGTATSQMTWGDLVSTENEGSVSYDYVRWLIGAAHGPEVEIDDPAGCPCGRWGYSQADFNQDCVVNLDDLKQLAAQWTNCTDPTNPTCENTYATGGTTQWEYLYEADALPGVAGCILNDEQAGIAQFSGTGAVTAPDGVVSVAGGILTIDDTAASGNHYCQLVSTTGLWNGRGATVELKMSITNWVAPNNVHALVIGDGINTYEWWVSPTNINAGSYGSITMDMTQLRTIRVAFPSSGPAILHISSNTCPGYPRSSTFNGFRFGDMFSNTSGHLEYDYVRWLTTGAYGFDTQINVP